MITNDRADVPWYTEAEIAAANAAFAAFAKCLNDTAAKLAEVFAENGRSIVEGFTAGFGQMACDFPSLIRREHWTRRHVFRTRRPALFAVAWSMRR